MFASEEPFQHRLVEAFTDPVSLRMPGLEKLDCLLFRGAYAMTEAKKFVSRGLSQCLIHNRMKTVRDCCIALR